MLQTTLSKTPLNPLKSIAKTPTVRLIALPLLMLFAPMLANAAPTIKAHWYISLVKCLIIAENLCQ